MARSYMEIFSYLNFFWHIYPVTFHLIICSCSPFAPFPDIVVTFLLKVAQNRSRKFVARVSYTNKLVNAAPISRLYAAKAVRKAALQEQHIKEVYVYTYTHVWEAGLIGCTCETGAGAEMGPQWPTNVQNKGPRTKYSTDVSKSPASFWGEMAWP